jgi:hypothetical protein
MLWVKKPHKPATYWIANLVFIFNVFSNRERSRQVRNKSQVWGNNVGISHVFYVYTWGQVVGIHFFIVRLTREDLLQGHHKMTLCDWLNLNCCGDLVLELSLVFSLRGRHPPVFPPVFPPLIIICFRVLCYRIFIVLIWINPFCSYSVLV